MFEVENLELSTVEFGDHTTYRCGLIDIFKVLPPRQFPANGYLWVIPLQIHSKKLKSRYFTYILL